jgi:hypothetical protein
MESHAASRKSDETNANAVIFFIFKSPDKSISCFNPVVGCDGHGRKLSDRQGLPTEIYYVVAIKPIIATFLQQAKISGNVCRICL